MIINLNDKKAIVSASTAGIGFAIAKGLAGAEVIINGRTKEQWDRSIYLLKMLTYTLLNKSSRV